MKTTETLSTASSKTPLQPSPPPLLTAHWAVFAHEVFERIWLSSSSQSHNKSALVLLYEHFDDAYLFVSHLWATGITCSTPPYTQIKEYVYLELERDLYRQGVLKPVAKRYLTEYRAACDHGWDHEISPCMRRCVMGLLHVE